MPEVVPLVALSIEQETVQRLNDYAVAMREEHRWATALTALRRALAIDPTCPNLYMTLGCTLWNIGAFEEALPAMLEAARLEPNNGQHDGNLGLLYHSMRDYEKSDKHFELARGKCKRERLDSTDETKVKRLLEDDLGYRWDHSLALLERGRWTEGLPDYDTRIERRGQDLYPKTPFPIWQGEDLSGKTLFIQGEQGIGDYILFSRYIPEIKKRWPTCKLLAFFDPALWNLLWEFRDIVDFRLPRLIPWPEEIDYGTFLLSLPRWLDATPENIPPDPGLILRRARQSQAQKALALPQPKLPNTIKVGFAWTGNPAQSRNDLRSIPLAQMMSLFEDPRITPYSFQVGAGAQEFEDLKAGEIVCNLEPTLESRGLVLAAEAMLEMDLMITVCTSTAHLAGALGVPCWTLLSFDPYWIWMQTGENIDTTPFYPSVRLFRQEIPGDWEGVLEKVRVELEELFSAREIKAA